MADYEASFEATAPPARRRPSRVKSADDAAHSAPPSSTGTDDSGSKLSKTSRPTLKKTCKNHASAAPAPIYEEESAHWEDDTVGHMPNLGQIPEGHEDTRDRSRDSAVSSAVEPHARRRRHSEDSSSSRLRVRPKHGSLQRRAGSLAKHSNPSLASVLSGLTQPSTASESNTTITEKSHRHERRRKEKSSKGSKAQRRKRAEAPSVADTEATQSDVFQFLSQDAGGQDSQLDAQSVLQASSPSVTSSADSRDKDSKSSDASEGAHDTPRTSPTSTRRSYSQGAPYYGHYQQPSGKPLYQSSFVHGPGDEEAEDSEVYSDEESTYDASHMPHPSQPAPHWNYPPNSQPGNAHATHLRQQQHRFAGHVLQSPQPHHNVPYAGVLSPNVQPAVPFHDPRMYSGASPTDFSATASQASAWPPMASYPPPLAIGYSPESVAAYPHHSPVASHNVPMTVQSPMVAHADASHHLAMVPQPHSQRQGSVADDTVIGYELLAYKLSELKKEGRSNQEDTVVPAYRKFEQLNHRVLLHLQDEISELEEELRLLDHDIAQASPGGQTGHHHPASRRGDSLHGNDVHRRRIDVLGRVYQKLEQYNRALSAFNDVKSLPSASRSDVDRYRAWMKQRNPIHEAESRFLERQTDLVAFSPRREASIGHGAGTSQHAAMWLPLLPFVAFSVVPSLLGRIIVIALISAAGLKRVTSTPELTAILTIREWMYATWIYFGSMSVLALLVR
ncbi:uncharacterized protein EKO05_0000515 [Ascochyta rabiei]|uniref:uncharacterized protein n=1 Tax=Didymella rabiei TaxID=5454 RepID=UPI00220C986C|nr:uncharacterized protein EKO05_0000515 [Ascochyta rabiei]UPX09834.1 hypothetical protein EKO05_0000515 [Ascochyta rabiei]